MIDTDKLEKLQKYSRTIALVGMAIFFALIGVSLWSLLRVRNEISSLESKKQELTGQVAAATEQVNQKKEELKSLEMQQAVLSQTLSAIAKDQPASVKKAIGEVTADQVNQAPSRDTEKRKLEYTERAIGQLIQAAPRVARELTRVYLQIGNESQRGKAKEIATKLKQAGYLVPGIENVGEQAPNGPTEIRYFARTDAEREEANKIVNLLKDWGINTKNAPIRIATKPWQYEIWFSSDWR